VSAPGNIFRYTRTRWRIRTSHAAATKRVSTDGTTFLSFSRLPRAIGS
jgi:hypothetical protein